MLMMGNDDKQNKQEQKYFCAEDCWMKFKRSHIIPRL